MRGIGVAGDEGVEESSERPLSCDSVEVPEPEKVLAASVHLRMSVYVVSARGLHSRASPRSPLSIVHDSALNFPTRCPAIQRGHIVGLQDTGLAAYPHLEASVIKSMMTTISSERDGTARSPRKSRCR